MDCGARLPTEEQIIDDLALLWSVGSHRPIRGGLLDLMAKTSDAELLEAQQKFDAAVAEMKRRKDERGFVFTIPH